VADLQAAGIDARWIAADCAVEADMRSRLATRRSSAWAHGHPGQQCRRRLGRPGEDYPVEAWDKVMNLNMRGYFILSQHIAKHSMIARKRGRIINIASISGLGGNPPDMQTLAYNTSKGAVVNFTRRWPPNGAATTSTSMHLPGLFPEQDDAGALKALGEEALASHAPLGRWATTKTSRA
jgi:NAD(P)-dependent dehydrogenase (short-subunit alcohol dehydrogenase family)